MDFSCQFFLLLQLKPYHIISLPLSLNLQLFHVRSWCTLVGCVIHFQLLESALWWFQFFSFPLLFNSLFNLIVLLFEAPQR